MDKIEKGIYRTSKGKYQYHVSYKDKATGKIYRRQGTFASLEECQKARFQKKAELSGSNDKFYSHLAKSENPLVYSHILPKLGNTNLKNLTNSKLDNFYEGLNISKKEIKEIEGILEPLMSKRKEILKNTPKIRKAPIPFKKESKFKKRFKKIARIFKKPIANAVMWLTLLTAFTMPTGSAISKNNSVRSKLIEMNVNLNNPVKEGAPKVVYISPSNQFRNPYAVGNTTEGEQMFKLANVLKDKLEKAGYKVIIAKKFDGEWNEYNMSKVMEKRAFEAAENGADLYIALHTNASGNSDQLRGTDVYFNSNSSENLAKDLSQTVGSLNGNNGIHKNNTIYELKLNKKYNIPAVLIESDYHDNKAGAEYIINNMGKIADSIVKGANDYIKAISIEKNGDLTAQLKF